MGTAREVNKKGAGPSGSADEKTRHSAVSPWVLLLASPVLLILFIPFLLYLVIFILSKAVVDIFWRRPGSNKFRVVRKRTVRPHVQRKYRAALSHVDKTLCPLSAIGYLYVWDHDVDVDKACQALANIITELPVLSGRIMGFMVTTRVICDHRAGVEVVEAETDHALADMYYNSPAIARITTLHPCGFGAGDWWDSCRPLFNTDGAPVVRVRFTRLSGGGMAMSVAAAHYVMDAKGLMKLVEIWVKETRRLSQMQEEDGLGKVEHKEGLDEGEDQERLARGRDEWNLLPSTAINKLVVEGAGLAPPLTVYGFLRQTWQHVCSAACQWFVMVPGGMRTKTFFFSDEYLMGLKKEIMGELRQRKAAGDTSLPDYVSTNDIVSAIMWQGMQRVPCLQRQPCSASMARMMVDARELPVFKSVKGGTNKFLMGNAVLEGRAVHRHPPSASLLELSCLLRQSILKLHDEQEALKFLGGFKTRDQILGIWMGSGIMDWYPPTDVVLSYFNPLENDTDFMGKGAAFLYMLEFTPPAFYFHATRGVDRYDGNRKGVVVHVQGMKIVGRTLSKLFPEFLPTPPPPIKTSEDTSDHKK